MSDLKRRGRKWDAFVVEEIPYITLELLSEINDQLKRIADALTKEKP